MVRTFLVRGMLVGIVAGLLSFAFLKIYGEPQVDLAVAFETQQDEAKAAAQKAESHDHATRPIRSRMDSPPCGAAVGSLSQELAAPGSSTTISLNLFPAQRP